MVQLSRPIKKKYLYIGAYIANWSLIPQSELRKTSVSFPINSKVYCSFLT